MILHSPTERANVVKHLRAAASDIDCEVESSPLCERRGVDFMWRERGSWWGVQRKELHDLLASFDDGRLTKEIAQMQAAITMPHLLIEGRIRVDNEGNVGVNGWGRGITISQLRSRLLTIQSRGVVVTFTSDIADTGRAIVDTYGWTWRDHHSTSTSRPKPTGAWGKPTNREYQSHLLQGLPDVGAKTATAILDYMGRCPLVLDASEAELLAVPGIGKVTARRIMATAPTRGAEVATDG